MNCKKSFTGSGNRILGLTCHMFLKYGVEIGKLEERVIKIIYRRYDLVTNRIYSNIDFETYRCTYQRVIS